MIAIVTLGVIIASLASKRGIAKALADEKKAALEG